eukprot:CAMPEP_0197867654 /NCGR_PEP_ID=MMETSP1438-20131217/44867_1 /TAXON_ID=1461541 /ORGANISM="Pterosperma sp., Strain CCMP1384" /LENGTH=75 /DNA_ID=CAMNT_0043486315 /DNA_START=521 /DNA_END=748 /DNA_ORIENTATION=+
MRDDYHVILLLDIHVLPCEVVHSFGALVGLLMDPLSIVFVLIIIKRSCHPFTALHRTLKQRLTHRHIQLRCSHQL